MERRFILGMGVGRPVPRARGTLQFPGTPVACKLISSFCTFATMTNPAAASDAATGEPRQQQLYANPHIERVINSTFEPSSRLQHISDGSNLRSAAFLDPSNPLTIDRPILITDTPESIGMRVPRGAPMSPRKAAAAAPKPPA